MAGDRNYEGDAQLDYEAEGLRGEVTQEFIEELHKDDEDWVDYGQDETEDEFKQRHED